MRVKKTLIWWVTGEGEGEVVTEEGEVGYRRGWGGYRTGWGALQERVRWLQKRVVGYRRGWGGFQERNQLHPSPNIVCTKCYV
jgi:hypothetical protein